MYSTLLTSTTIIKYDKKNPFSGILQQTFHKNSKENIVLNGNIKIVASSYEDSNINAIVGENNPEFNTYFETLDFPNSWIQFEFSNFKVNVQKYLYRTKPADLPNKWELQGSNNNRTWNVLDTREIQNSDDKSKPINNEFECNKKENNQHYAYSYIRLQSKGPRSSSYNGINRLPVYGFEIYGEICSNFQCPTFQESFHIHFSLFYIISLI